jgi:hypothetical protein
MYDQRIDTGLLMKSSGVVASDPPIQIWLNGGLISFQLVRGGGLAPCSQEVELGKVGLLAGAAGGARSRTSSWGALSRTSLWGALSRTSSRGVVGSGSEIGEESYGNVRSEKEIKTNMDFCNF